MGKPDVFVRKRRARCILPVRVSIMTSSHYLPELCFTPGLERTGAPRGAPSEATRALWVHTLSSLAGNKSAQHRAVCLGMWFEKRALDQKSLTSCWIWPKDGCLSLGCWAWPWTSDFTLRVPFFPGYNPCAACCTGCVKRTGAKNGTLVKS